MFSLESSEDTVTCPYNKSHQMLRKRLQSHLIKCRVSYPDVELQKCPFNQTHLIPEPEFVHHVTNCSDRKLITQYKYDGPEIKKEEDEERVKQKPIECEDNWDDTNVEDYNPKKYVEQAKVLRQAEGTQPAQRKAFIKQERKRLGDCMSSDDDDDDAKACAKVKRIKYDTCHSDNSFVNEFYKSPPPAPRHIDWNARNKKAHSRTHSDRREKLNRSEGSSLKTAQESRNSSYELDQDPYYCGSNQDFSNFECESGSGYSGGEMSRARNAGSRADRGSYRGYKPNKYTGFMRGHYF